MGRKARLKKQRRQGSKNVPDIGQAWMGVHGQSPCYMAVRPTVNYVVDWHPGRKEAKITIPSTQLGQIETMTLLTYCDSSAELKTIKRVIEICGFGTEGLPKIEKRFYCEESQRWVVPVQVNLRLFYDLA